MKKIVLLSCVISVFFGYSTIAMAGGKGNAANGKKVFTQNCVTCHGASGKGDGVAAAALTPKPRNFVQGKFKYGSKDADLAKTIKNGKAPMPPWGGVLSDKDINDVVAYIRTFKK